MLNEITKKQKEALKKIDEKLHQVKNLLEEATKIADEAEVCFTFHAPDYSGITYKPPKFVEKWHSSTLECYPDAAYQYEGWHSSSEYC